MRYRSDREIEDAETDDGAAYEPRKEDERMSKTTTKFRFAVTGDFDRMVYSRHQTRAAAERACRALAAKWGHSHPGSEPRVVEVVS